MESKQNLGVKNIVTRTVLLVSFVQAFNPKNKSLLVVLYEAKH